MQHNNSFLLLGFAHSVYLAKKAGTNVELRVGEAQQILDRVLELEEGFERLLDCYLEAEAECEKRRAWMYMLNGGRDVEHMPDV